MTATEASRSFAALLDEAERGGTTVVTRGGRRIATIGPATAANGGAVRDLLVTADLDDDFEADVRSAREAAVAEAPAWPED
ncbi:MAG TPA: prevent-host-death protein [Propionibacteriaceae bacterium]|nr:prevent-host-death protein [Propionibacteriaceae bacterium]